jgi:hypothetical protein
MGDKDGRSRVSLGVSGTSFSMGQPPNPDRFVRDVVAEAERRRRARLVRARIRQIAPIAAGAALGLAVLARLFGWSPWTGAIVLAAAAIGLIGYLAIEARTRPTTDAVAAAVDADAGLSGELRSAHWFEAQPNRDAWAEFHLHRATERARAVDWAGLYPAVRAVQPWVITAVLSVLAVGLAFRMPTRAQPVAATAGTLDANALPTDGLSPELREKLAALIAQLNQAVADKDPSSKEMALADLKNMMAKMDPALQQKLADMLEKQAQAAAQGKKAEPSAPAERADAAQKPPDGTAEDVKWALDNAAAKKAQSQEGPQKAGQGNPQQATKQGERGAGPPQAQQATDAAGLPATPMMRETAEQQNGKLMMGGGPMGGDSRPGSGVTNDAAKGAAQALLVAQALKKELVEASADALGENVDKEDLRRKTEQGKSSLGFTRVAAPRSEPSRATAPPPVPEARRPLLFNYFIRRR